MAAFDEADVVGGVQPGNALHNVLDPGPCCIDEGARLDDLRAAVLALHLELPCIPCPACTQGSRARQDPSAMTQRIDEIEDHQPRIIDPAIGIFEAATKLGPQWGTFDRARQIEAAARRQTLTAAEMIVKEQPGPNQPGGTLLRRMRQHEAHRPDNMGRRGEQNLPFDQRLPYQAKLAIFEITQAAMHKLARARRRAFGEIVFLAEQNLQAAAGCIARDAGPVNTSADDGDIDES